MVDASQGVEAQSVANCYTAIDLDLEIEVLPVLNKIDLPAGGRPIGCKLEIEEIIGLDTVGRARWSAPRPAAGVDGFAGADHRPTFPPPSGSEGNPNGPLQALIIDSWFDSYVGVVTLVRVVARRGESSRDQKIRMMSKTARTGSCSRRKSGIFTPKREDPADASCRRGSVGYVIAGIKQISSRRAGR